MLETKGKLLLGAFIAIIISTALISTIGDDVELAKTSSYTVLNETLSFTSITTDISNETVTLTGNTTGQLANDNVTAVSGLRNNSIASDSIIGSCNVTIGSGAILCNNTQNGTIYVDYTYVSTRYDSLANDEIISLDAVRNSTTGSAVYTTSCDIIYSSGYINCSNPHSAIGYADYTYEPDTYVHSSAARTMLTLTVVFFAIAILAIGIGLVWKSLKEDKLT